MDAITSNNTNKLTQVYSKPDIAIASNSKDVSKATNHVQLTDISELADRASKSADDIRPEAVERAKRLLSDPDWLNDTSLEKLADKILSTEDFSG